MGRIIALLTDFGLQDPYVGVMKGVIAQIHPEAIALDITHEIPPQDVGAARFCLVSAFAYFPKGTVFVAVVDPGVGSNRRAIALECDRGFIIAPDNGLCSGVLERHPAIAAVELTQPAYWLTPNPSSTFHGRDIFAPVAAHLTKSVPLTELGTAIAPETLVSFPLPPWSLDATGITGCIQYGDRFGNLVTNIPNTCVEGKSWQAIAAGKALPGDRTYSDVAPGELLALTGSHGFVELAVNGGSARSRLFLEIGSLVRIDFT